MTNFSCCFPTLYTSKPLEKKEDHFRQKKKFKQNITKWGKRRGRITNTIYSFLLEPDSILGWSPDPLLTERVDPDLYAVLIELNPNSEPDP